MFLRDALGNPDDVAALLFLELHPGEKRSEVELLHEHQKIQLNLVLEKLVF